MLTKRHPACPHPIPRLTQYSRLLTDHVGTRSQLAQGVNMCLDKAVYQHEIRATENYAFPGRHRGEINVEDL